MPQTKSAKKALRQDRRRRATNQLVREKVRQTLRLTKGKFNLNNLAKAFSALDQAAKKGIIHPNKTARLKSRLSKTFRPKVTTKTSAMPKNKAVKRK